MAMILGLHFGVFRSKMFSSQQLSEKLVFMGFSGSRHCHSVSSLDQQGEE